MTEQECVSGAIRLVNAIIPDCTSFKIGKTGQDVEDRRKEPDYQDLYPNIKWLISTPWVDAAGRMEAALIDAFIDNSRCDNIKDGEASVNDNMAEAERYFVYIVWR